MTNKLMMQQPIDIKCLYTPGSDFCFSCPKSMYMPFTNVNMYFWICMHTYNIRYRQQCTSCHRRWISNWSRVFAACPGDAWLHRRKKICCWDQKSHGGLTHDKVADISRQRCLRTTVHAYQQLMMADENGTMTWMWTFFGHSLLVVSGLQSHLRWSSNWSHFLIDCLRLWSDQWWSQLNCNGLLWIFGFGIYLISQNPNHWIKNGIPWCKRPAICRLIEK